MTMRVSKDRIDMSDNVLQKAVLKDYGETVVTANSSTSYTIDLTNGNVFNITMTGNCAFTFSNPPASGTAGSFILLLTQDSTGSRTATWPAAVTWVFGSEPTLGSTYGDVDLLSFNTIDGGTTWFGSHLGTTSTLPASGGTFSTSSGDNIHTYTSSGTLTVYESITVDVLVVAGGGGGGGTADRTGGGGGAGGLVYQTSRSVTPGTYTVTIGAGGAGGISSGAVGDAGSNSVFDTITAVGGGGGGAGGVAGGDDGGSAGGGSHNNAAGTATQGDSGGGTGYGNDGGAGYDSAASIFTAGGGGGAGAAGSAGTSGGGGVGGVGNQYTISGSSTYYAGGGGGGAQGASAGAGGSGGGGAGASSGAGTDATANTGGGGGGCGDNSAGGDGGSGVVIIRYTP